MADEIDIANDQVALIEEAGVALIRQQAAKFVPGEPGECEMCGEDMPRLVEGVCCRCRDKYNLK